MPSIPVGLCFLVGTTGVNIQGEGVGFISFILPSPDFFMKQAEQFLLVTITIFSVVRCWYLHNT